MAYHGLSKIKPKEGVNMTQLTQTKTSDIVIPEIVNDSNFKPITKITNEYQTKIEKLKKPNSWVRWLIAAGAVTGSLVLLSLIANQIITGAIALGVVAAVGGIGFVSYKLIKKFDPVVQEKIKNAVITQLIKEAQEKKIETLVRYKQTLEQYLKQTRNIRNKNDMLMKKYHQKLENTTDEFLKSEYAKMLKKLLTAKESLEIIENKAKENLKNFDRQLTIAKEKYDYIQETEEIVNFLKNSGNSLEKFLVDESLNQLEKEFLSITTEIENLAKDIKEEV